jgi:fibronectin type 3 domain-containing protein
MRRNNLVNAPESKKWKEIENNVFSNSKAGIVVDRLVKSQWDQVWPWNDLCPLKGGNPDSTTYVGCVATAMAQILNYHKWPNVGVGSGSTTFESQTLSANFTTHTWDWSKMVDVVDMDWGLYPEYWEDFNVDSTNVYEMALLSYWCGLSVSMSYSTTGSGAYSFNADNAFLDHWKASSSVYTSMGTISDPTANATVIRAELDAKRPWYWSGGVHAFILDGYTDDYWYHFNWGWAGTADGWYQLNDLTPDQLGSGSGDLGDYTADQERITYVPSTNPFTAWPATTISGSVLNSEDVSLSWSSQTGATGYKVYRTSNREGLPELIATITGTSYTDADLTTGEYAYYVIVTYASGESHNSNSYSATISVVSGYPVARSLVADVNGRTSIDLSWTEPFVGVLNQFVDYESGLTCPTGWLEKASRNSTRNVNVWVDDGLDVNYPTDGTADNLIIFAHESSYTAWNDYPQLQGHGNFMLMSATGAADAVTEWFLSPSITFNSGHSIKWWNRFRYTDNDGLPVMQRPKFQIVSYSGDFTEQRYESNIAYTVLATYDGTTSPENIWATENSVSLASLAGTTTRIGIRVAPNTNDLYTLAFDNITIGSTTGGGDNPTGYQVYRDGSLASTVASGTTYTYSDTGFADGENTYYVKAVYPTGVSIPGNHITALMDANPKPDYLTGTGGTQADLSWYVPYHNAPKWYAHIDPSAGISTTALGGENPIQRKRVIFKSTDLGFYYPITLDTVAAVFYDEAEGNWGGQNKYKFRVLTGGSGAWDNVVYESAELTAVHNTMAVHALTTPLVLSEPFNVEVYNTVASDNPANLMGRATGGSTHSYNYNSSVIPASYTYGIKFGDDVWAEWCFLAHIVSSAPSKTAQDGWVKPGSSVIEPSAKAYAKEPRIIAAPSIKGSKALDHYKIYRNGAAVGTSTNTTYTDTGVTVTGDYTYKVTASYVSPAGESAPSNEIVLNVTASAVTPGVPANVTTSIVSGNVYINWDDAANATSYDVYSSATPYGTYSLLTNVTGSEYTYTGVAGNTKMFFYIVSKNGTKGSPKTIMLFENGSEK